VTDGLSPSVMAYDLIVTEEKESLLTFLFLHFISSSDEDVFSLLKPILLVSSLSKHSLERKVIENLFG